VPRGAAGASLGAVLPGRTVASGVREAVWLLAAVPVRRNDRAGDDGEFGAGSGISQANAAGETVGAAELDGLVPDGTAPDGLVPDGAALEDTVLDDGELEYGEADDGEVDDGDLDAGPLGGAGGRGVGSATGDFPAASLLAGVRVASFCWLPRDGLRLSAGKAGTMSTMVASASAPLASALPGVAVSA